MTYRKLQLILVNYYANNNAYSTIFMFYFMPLMCNTGKKKTNKQLHAIVITLAKCIDLI